MKVIVLSTNKYKEKDAVFSAISESQFVTFLARGINKPTSKNAAINNPLTIADVELEDRDLTHPILKTSKQLFTPMKIEMDSKYLGAIMTMDEVVLYLFPDEEKHKMFSFLEQGIVSLRKTNDWLMTLLIFFANAIRLGGFELEVNRCVICGKKQKIVAFSFVDGGFICQDCFQEDTEHDLSKNQMILLRKIFNSRDFSLLSYSYNQEDALALFNKILYFIQEAFGYTFKNIRLLID